MAWVESNWDLGSTVGIARFIANRGKLTAPPPPV